MKQSNIDFMIAANDLSGAAKGLGSFVYDRFSTTDIERADLHALQGLVKAIQIMADKNANDIEKVLDSGGAAIE